MNTGDVTGTPRGILRNPVDPPAAKKSVRFAAKTDVVKFKQNDRPAKISSDAQQKPKRGGIFKAANLNLGKLFPKFGRAKVAPSPLSDVPPRQTNLVKPRAKAARAETVRPATSDPVKKTKSDAVKDAKSDAKAALENLKTAKALLKQDWKDSLSDIAKRSPGDEQIRKATRSKEYFDAAKTELHYESKKTANAIREVKQQLRDTVNSDSLDPTTRFELGNALKKELDQLRENVVALGVRQSAFKEIQSVDTTFTKALADVRANEAEVRKSVV